MTHMHNVQIQKMRVCASSKNDIWNIGTWQVVHNISNSITKLTQADVSTQDPQTLRSLPPPLNWKHKKITQANRHEVNAGLFQFSATTVHLTCSDDDTHVVWSMDGCGYAVLWPSHGVAQSPILPIITSCQLWMT